MTEYIARAELMGQLTNGEEQKRIKAMTGQEAYDRFLELVNGAADVAQAQHGQWIESVSFDEGFWVCSQRRYTSAATAAPMLYNYCPNCGAKMRGVNDG